MTEPADPIRQAALALDPAARPAGTGWLTRCPAHDDRHPSLQLAAGAAGAVAAVCLAGCDPESVRKAARDRNVHLAG